MSDNETIAANVASLRKAQGMSQAALADAMRERGQDHWRQNTVSRVETGKQSLSVGEVIALEEILGGPLMRGTEFNARFKEFSAHVVRAGTAKRLKRADEALTSALEEIRELRWVHDDAFAKAHPEYGEREL